MAITLGSFTTINDRNVLTGLSGSGLDGEGLITGLVAIKEIPKNNLQDRIDLNGNKVDAYGEFRTILTGLKDAVNFMRNPPGVQNDADNVFKYRSAALSSNTGVAASSYLSVAVEPGASVQNYSISEITSLARVTKQRTATFNIASADTSVTTAAATPGSFKAGTVTINGADITLEAGDTLNEVAAKFNDAKATTGIEASIIQQGTGQYTLSFTATASGTAAAFDLNDPGTVTADPDGVLNFIGRTNLVSNGTFDSDITGTTDASLGTGSIAYDGIGALQLDGDGAGGNEAFAQQALTTEIGKTYTVTGTFASLASSAYIRVGSGSDVSLASNSDIADIEVAADGTASFTFVATGTTTYLTINSDTNTDPFTVDDLSVVDNSTQAVSNTQTATDASFVIDGVTITRDSNVITDVIDGVTFTLTQPTPALTTIDVNVAADTALPVSGVVNFINAFNSLRVFVAEQSATTEDGAFEEEAYLAAETLLRTLSSTLSTELSNSVTAAGSYNTLASVGITFADLPETSDTPFTRNILNIDEQAFTAALADSFDSVEKLFGFSSTTTNSNVAVFRSNNTVTASAFSLNIDPNTSTFEAVVDSVTYNLTATATSTGYTLKGPAGSPLEGLTLIYASTEAGTADVTISQGIANRIFNVLDNLLDEQEGQLQLEIGAIEDSNTRLETEIERIDRQIDIYRELLITRFSALESLLSSLNTLLDSLDAQQLALYGNN